MPKLSVKEWAVFVILVWVAMWAGSLLNGLIPALGNPYISMAVTALVTITPAYLLLKYVGKMKTKEA